MSQLLNAAAVENKINDLPRALKESGNFPNLPAGGAA